MKKFWEEFKAFAIKGNVIDLAVAVVIGGAFGKIVSSLVNDLLMPVLTLLTGGRNVSGLFLQLGGGDVVYPSIDAAKEAGVSTLNYGMFVQTVIDFFIIALGIFLFVKLMNAFKKKEAAVPAPVERKCPFCLETVADGATRCPHCTSDITEE
ncbi:MAG: large conductance mechanosensitive channel protein MscL [Christensenellales bacterium]|jgi:large conductance mechanosensitive channel